MTASGVLTEESLISYSFDIAFDIAPDIAPDIAQDIALNISPDIASDVADLKDSCWVSSKCYEFFYFF